MKEFYIIEYCDLYLQIIPDQIFPQYKYKFVLDLNLANRFENKSDALKMADNLEEIDLFKNLSSVLGVIYCYYDDDEWKFEEIGRE